MWSPTHIQVTVQRARGLLIKGKNGTNNCFVTIALGKEKYQTSIKDKVPQNVDWHEECELAIPDQGNKAELILTCLHRNNLGLDEFLGQVTLPLNEMDVYERPRSKWFKLESKPGQEKKNKERGEIEVRILFVVKAGSLTDLSKKEKQHHRSSLSHIASSVGGSLLSLGTIEKRKGIKKFAKSLGQKIHSSGGKSKNKDDKDSDSNFSGSISSINTPINISQNYHQQNIQQQQQQNGQKYGQTKGDADPGVISEDEDEFTFENLSHKSSGSSLNTSKGSSSIYTSSPVFKQKEDHNLRVKTLPSKSSAIGSGTDIQFDEWTAKLYGKNLDVGSTDSLKRRSWETPPRTLLSTKEVSETEYEDKSSTENFKTTMDNKSIKSIKSDERSDTEVKQKEIKEQQNENYDDYQSNTAPTSPNLKMKQPTESPIVNHKIGDNLRSPIRRPPNRFPRSNTTGNLLESVSKESEKDKAEKSEKRRFSKLKYFRKDKHESPMDTTTIPSVGHNQFERIIIGHENHILKAGDKIEVSKDILKKYEGKSREEIMLIANGLEGEVRFQRQRVKELEDYLDNLLLKVMETHPKILQNPYPDRNLSTKSG